MTLTNRGRGVVAGLLLSCIAVLAMTFHGGGEPILHDPGMGVEQQDGNDAPWNWKDTVETVGGEFNEVPLDENGQPVTNPCPYEMQMQGICDGGW
jgi:hypothetical protein